ncbi:hypothetical protein ES703_51807 [subsurface metagenome]
MLRFVFIPCVICEPEVVIPFPIAKLSINYYGDKLQDIKPSFQGINLSL